MLFPITAIHDDDLQSKTPTDSCLTSSNGKPCTRAQHTQCLPKFGKPHYQKDIVLMLTIWYSTEYYVDIDVLRIYLFWIEFDNLIFRLFHTFGCKQTISKMFTDSFAFATIGDTHGEHPVIPYGIVRKGMQGCHGGVG